MRRLARHHDKPSACGAASLQVAAVGRPAPHSRLSPRAAVRTLRLFRFPSLQKSQRWPNTHQHNMRRPPQIRERRRAGSELFDNVLPAGHRPVRQGIFLCPVLGSSRRPRISNYIVSLCAQPFQIAGRAQKCPPIMAGAWQAQDGHPAVAQAKTPLEWL